VNNDIVDKESCAMCLADIRSAHLATFYALGRKGVDLKVCADHDRQIQTAVASVRERFAQ
jgi:hypothetical protein